jgi:hypothetical protein
MRSIQRKGTQQSSYQRAGQAMALYDRLESSRDGIYTATVLASIGRRDALLAYLDELLRYESTRLSNVVPLAA